MHKLIKKLAKRADLEYTGIADDDMGDCLIGNSTIQKFAESIIIECAGVTLDFKNDAYYNGWVDHSDEILKRYGITK